MRLTICLLLAFWLTEGIAYPQTGEEPARSTRASEIDFHPAWYREVWPVRASQLAEAISAPLIPVSDNASSDATQREGNFVFRRVNGTFQIPSEFGAKKALKLGLVKPGDVSLLFSNGQGYILCRFYPNYHQSWAAYRAVIDSLNDNRTWQPTALLATDQGRYRQSGMGSVLVFWENSDLILACGGTRLLTVPFRDPPKEIRLAGTTLLRELRWLDGVPPPPLDSERLFPDAFDHPTSPLFLASRMVVNGSIPASQPWERWPQSKEVTVHWDESGEIGLSAEDVRERTYLGFPIVVNGVCDIVFRVREATPGTGVFLADKDRRPIGGLGFYRHTQSGRLLFGFHTAQDDNWERGADPNQLLAITDGSQWFRITVSAGVLRYWVSCDGKVWSPAGPFNDHADRRPAFCGIFLTKGPTRKIVLRDLYVYEGLVPSDEKLARLTEEVPDSIATASDWERWCELVVRNCPDTSTLQEWRMACAFRSIAENPPAHLGQRILEQLWDDVLSLDLPMHVKLNCSAVFARWVSLVDWGIYERLTPRLRRLAWQLAGDDPTHAFTVITEHLLRIPYWAQWRLPVFFTDLYRHELFAALAKNDTEHLQQLGLRVLRASVPGNDAVSDELRYLAVSTAARTQATDVMPNETPSQARQSLVIVPNREAYNFAQEIAAALADNDPRQVTQLILLAGREEMRSLYPDPLDPGRYCSFPLFVHNLLEQYPAVRQLVLEQCQEIGKVQLRQAQSSGREDLAEEILYRFPETPIAAEAALWLGDRYLVLGDRRRATAYYGYIGPNSPPELRDQRSQRAKACPQIVSLIQSDEQTLHEGRVLVTHDIVSIDGVLGNDISRNLRTNANSAALKYLFSVESPGIHRPPSMPDREFNWLKEQVTFLPLDDCLVMHAQADLRLFDWAGTLSWSQQSGVSSDNTSRAMVAMCPLLYQDRIICRRLTQRGSELVCLDLFDGHVIWAQRLGDYVVSDPWIQDEVVQAVVGTGLEIENYQLTLVALDVRDGSVRQRSPLAVLNNVLDVPLDCHVVPQDRWFLIQANGCLMLFDSLGRPIWLRSFPWLAPASSSWWHAQSWYTQRDPRPLIVGDHVFVSMRGGWFVACVELKTGKLCWYQPMGHLRGLFAYADGKLYVETSGSMWILEATTGRKLGQYNWPARAEKAVVAPTRLVMAFQSRSEERDRRHRRLVMQCIQLDDGTLLREIDLGLIDRELEWIGPVMTHHGKVYILLARPNQPQRFEVYELVLAKDDPQLASADQISALHK